MPTKARPGLDPVHRALIGRIRDLSRKRRLSSNKLAGLSGLAQGYVSDFLAGKKSPTVRTLIKIARTLDVQVRDLFG